MDKFEKKLKKITRVKHVIAEINGTQGLYVSMLVLEIKKIMTLSLVNFCRISKCDNLYRSGSTFC